MTKKDYLIPSVEVIEMGYRDPVCQAMSGQGTDSVPEYDIFGDSVDWII